MKQNIAELISTARQEKNLSMRELARLSGINNSEISKIESGKRLMPKLKTLKAICRHLDIYYEDCLFTLNLGGTYNINNPIIINYYQNINTNNIKSSYKGILSKIKENNKQITYMKSILLQTSNKEDKNVLIDTIKSLEFENKTNNFIKNILTEKIVKIYLDS